MSIRVEIRSLLVTTLALAAVTAVAAAQSTNAPWDGAHRYVFAQDAHGFRFDGTKLVLENIPSTVYFAGQPDRRFGHISNRDFAKLWNESFTAAAPYAVLSILEDRAAEIVLELKSPRVDGGNITYDATVVSGSPPANGGVCALFLDPSRARPAAPAVTEREPINARDRKARQTMAAFKAKDPGIKRFFEQSEGYAVFPSIAKGAFIVGGARGDGTVYRKGEVIGYSTVTQGTIGLQIGGQEYSEIVFFEDDAALKHFTNGNLEFAGQASAVAVTEGASADAKYADGVLVVTMAKGGLMLEASLGGQKFTFDEK